MVPAELVFWVVGVTLVLSVKVSGAGDELVNETVSEKSIGVPQT